MGGEDQAVAWLLYWTGTFSFLAHPFFVCNLLCGLRGHMGGIW